MNGISWIFLAALLNQSASRRFTASSRAFPLTLSCRFPITSADQNGSRSRTTRYYSTAHWHPIVNGYARTEPPGYRDRITRIATFPSSDCADAMRAIGADYLVFHAGRYPGGAADRLEHAKSSSDFMLVGQSGSDYLYRVR